MNLLLVEDNLPDVRIIQELLKESPTEIIELTHVNRLADAIISFRQYKPDLVFLDLGLPDSQGTDTLIRFLDSCPEALVIILTGYANPEMAATALQFGAQDYLIKDHLHSENLHRTIRYARERYRNLLKLKQNEKDFRQNSEIKESILNALPSNIALLDADGTIVAVNESWRRFAKENSPCSTKSSIGDNYLKYCEQTIGKFSDEAQAVAQGLKSIFNLETETFSLDYPCHCQDKKRWFHLILIPLLENVNGGAVAMHIDITEQKNSEKNLRILSKAVEQSPNSTMVTNPSGQIEFVNREFTLLTGYTQEEIKGKNPNILKGGETSLEIYKELWSTILSGKKWQGELHNRKKDGTLFWEDASISPVFGKKGRIEHFVAIKVDITERKRIHRAINMITKTNLALVHSKNESRLLSAVRKIAEQEGGYFMSWIGYKSDIQKNALICQKCKGAIENCPYLIRNFQVNENVICGHSQITKIALKGKVFTLQNLDDLANNDPLLKMAFSKGVKSVIGLPLTHENSVFGSFLLFRSEPDSPSSKELDLLKDLAGNLSIGITSLRLSEERERLHKAVFTIARGLSPKSQLGLFHNLIQCLIEALDVDAGCLALMNNPDGTSAKTIAVRLDGKKIENFDYQLSETPCKNTLINCGVHIVSENVSQIYPEDSFLTDYGMTAYAGTSLYDDQGQLIGILSVTSRTPIKENEFVTSTLKIFTSRVSSELERQQTDVKLREQAALINETNDAILVIDMDYGIQFWNKSAERIYGWTAEEVLHSSIIDLLSVDREIYSDAFQQLLVEGEWLGEIIVKNFSGNDLFIDCRWTLVRDDQGAPYSFLAIERDITEKKKFDAQFLRAQRMESIGTLAGGIAHDLNNVLAPIMMSLDLIGEKLPDPESVALLQTLQSSAKRGAELVRQLLGFARGVEGDHIRIDPKHIMKEIQKVIHDTFPKNITFQLESAPDLLTVTGDPTQLHQVCMNLCVNARDAMPSGGKIEVLIENIIIDETFASMNYGAHAGSSIVISVKDSGVGIPKENMEKIFDPFFTTKKMGKGTGLGLSTTIAIVKNHKGFIIVNSEFGKGSEFRIYIPTSKESQQRETLGSLNSTPRYGQGELILIVDDEESIRIIFKNTLEKFGYRILSASNGAEAISIYTQHQSDISVVVTDIAMPIMDGNALIIALLSMNPEVRIIASSGLATAASLDPFVKDKIACFLQKPFTTEVILNTLHDLLAHGDASGDSDQNPSV
jgi:PAS domain S-box-containing protein